MRKKDKKSIFVKTVCAVCGSSESFIKYKSSFDISDFNPNTFLSRKIPKKSHYRMVICKKCGLLYSNPILKKRYIDKLYFEAKVPTHQDLTNASNIYFEYSNRILKNISKKSKILDVGCGNGFYMSLLKKKGFKNVFGVEPSRYSVKYLPKNIKKSEIKVGGYDKSLYPKETFDLICFFQVFDHLIDPNKFLKDCYYHLKKGGYVFALMHDTHSITQLLLKEKSPIIDVQHIYLFDKINIKRIFENNKLVVDQVFPTWSRYSLDYWLKMGPFPKFIKDWVSKNSKTKFLNLNIKFPPGNMAIIARKE